MHKLKLHCYVKLTDSSPQFPKRSLSPSITADVTPKRKCIKNKEMAGIRLPIPCPLPAAFSPAVQVAIQQNRLTGLLKLSMLRECSSFYQGICPRPKPFEYLEMSKSLCDKYPALRDEVSFNGEYWVRWYLLTRC